MKYINRYQKSDKKNWTNLMLFMLRLCTIFGWSLHANWKLLYENIISSPLNAMKWNDKQKKKSPAVHVYLFDPQY